MENVKMQVKGNKLTIEVDLNYEGTVSSTGKSVVVATTRGNQPVPGIDERVMVGLNVYKPFKK